MRRVIAPALLAVFVFAGTSADAGFGLFNKMSGHGCNSGCDMGCDMGCAAPVYMEPACGCEIAAPVCGCESMGCAAPRPKFGHKLRHFFGKQSQGCCDVAPTCGCEVAPVDCGCAVVEPACGFEPACGCEPAACGCGSKPKFGGLFKKLFNKRSAGCAPVCEPACGFEPSCGCGF